MKTYLDPHDVALMEKCADSARDKLLVRLLFRLGCRGSEVLNIKMADVDFEQSFVTSGYNTSLCDLIWMIQTVVTSGVYLDACPLNREFSYILEVLVG